MNATASLSTNSAAFLLLAAKQLVRKKAARDVNYCNSSKDSQYNDNNHCSTHSFHKSENNTSVNRPITLIAHLHLNHGRQADGGVRGAGGTVGRCGRKQGAYLHNTVVTSNPDSVNHTMQLLLMLGRSWNWRMTLITRSSSRKLLQISTTTRYSRRS